MSVSTKPNGSWTSALTVPAAKPLRRRGVRWLEYAVLAGVLTVIAALVLPGVFTEYVTYYRCIVCCALRADHRIDDHVHYETPTATEESLLYDSIAPERHRHRWTKPADSYHKSRLTGETFAFASREASPLYYLRGEERRRLWTRRLERDGSLKPLEAELHAIQDAWEQESSERARELMAPIWDAARAVDGEDSDAAVDLSPAAGR